MVELKKISDVEWEIPKEGKMLVPGKIFASDKLIESIKKDQTLEQVKNVAMLPGIIGASIALSDAHQGYGFPIGGVAAFDLDKGVISPGGVGYDINCLTGDSMILTEFGNSIQIKDFEKCKKEIEIDDRERKIKKIIFDTKLLTVDLKNKKIENKEINLFMSRNSNEVYEIELDSGLKIKATKEHPFLTKTGMKTISNLKQGNKLAVNLFGGVNSNYLVNEKEAILAKIMGYMLGDGSFYESKGKLYSAIYGSKEDLEVIKEDLERITVHSKIFSRERNHSIKTKYGEKKFNTINHELHIYSREFNNLLKEKGMPLGNKTRQIIRIPDWIKNSNKVIKRLFLSGFFGAEMSTPKSSSKTCFFCPTIDHNKIENLRQNARDFLIDISLLLEEFGINETKITEMDDYFNKYEEKTKRFRLFIKKEEQMLKLWKTIGFEYNKKRQNISNIASLYILLKKKENEKRKEIAKKIKKYKQKGFSLKEVQRIFSGKINERFIERHYYETAGQRINLDFISFNEFCKEKLLEIENFGVIFDTIKQTKKIEGTHKVYDFNIRDNHNFIANGFIVSNCGVRLLKTNLILKDLEKKGKKEIIHSLYRAIPSGVGKGSKLNLTKNELDEILEKGLQWLVEKGFGFKEDYLHTEEEGKLLGNPNYVSPIAKARGINQLGSIGSGNHFLEVQFVEKIFDKKTAEVFGLKEGMITIMIHCGSRGLGHQVASDYIKLIENEYGYPEQDRELVNAPIKSELGKKYLSAMNCAANFAFANRQLITHLVREDLKHYFPNVKIDLIYDVCHNIAKFEKHLIDGKEKTVLIMRKGATRSFGSNRKEIPEDYKKVGQPVLIPGTMGTSSYVLVGTEKAEQTSFASTAHGAGRVESRTKARREIKGHDIKKNLEKLGIIVEAGSWKGISEEAPQVYKDVDEVVDVSHKAGIGNLVAKLRPIGVIKG